MTLEALTGRLCLYPGRRPAIACERPIVGADLLGRLTRDRPVARVPDLLASVFTLCADAQRSTARRALQAALGQAAAPGDHAADARRQALHVAREHLQRLALDLPVRMGAAPAQAGWLSGAPVAALDRLPEEGLPGAASALPAWLHSDLLGLPAAAWLEAWQRDAGEWLSRWCGQHEHPVTRWLRAVKSEAQAVGWNCRVLDPADPHEVGMIAAAVEADAGFASAPVWQGAPAETGPWTRSACIDPVFSAWDRLGARIADLVRIALGHRLSQGALPLTEGVGLAWTEMSRGLLMHWVQLEPGERLAETARVARYQVLAPTEWNFHPEGALAKWLGAGAASAAQVRVAAAALDPCIEFSLDEAPSHA